MKALVITDDSGLVRAVGLIEEAYEKDFELLHPDNAVDYQEMIDALNNYGVK
jgi:hypothetical protein